MVKQPFKYLMLLILFGLTIAFGLTVFNRSRLPFDNGRYYDQITSIAIKEDSILFFTLLTALFILLTIAWTINLLRTRRKIKD